MPIRAECPAGHTMMVPDHRAGTHLRCPRCGVELLVPGAAVKKHVTTLEPASAQVAALPSPPVSPERLVIAADEVSATALPAATRIVVAVPPVAAAGVAESQPVEPQIPPPAPAARPVLMSPSARPSLPEPKGWVPDAAKQGMAVNLALLLAAMALLSIAPAVWEWYALWQNPDAPPTPPWVFAILIAGVLQLAYAMYLAQVPDWSALWMTTLAMLASAAAWATLLGTTLLARQESSLVLLFRYGDKLAGNRAAMWCFVMLCLAAVTAWFLGLTASRWHRSYCVLRELQER